MPPPPPGEKERLRREWKHLVERFQPVSTDKLLATLAQNAGDVRELAAIIRILSERDDEGLLPVFMDLLSSDDSWIRNEAVGKIPLATRG